LATGAAAEFVAMKNWRTSCLVGGERRTVINGLNDIGAAFHKLNPWYVGDLQARFQIKALNGAIRIPVRQKTIRHWWFSHPPTLMGVSNCEVTA
jgi:hypothetical protein